jgi:hypothetical protein
LDHRLGIDEGISLQARRLVALAGSSWAFERAAYHLEEFCGLSISDEWIRTLCHAEAERLEKWSEDSPSAVEKFRKSPGEIEFQTDGTCVNTKDGWREMRLGIVAKRLPGTAATPQEWNTRKLPKPSARVAFAAIEESETFAGRWRPWMSRLGIQETKEISILADGAEWIWRQSAIQLPGAQGLLDIYHAVEHVSTAAKQIFGEGTEAAKSWTDQGRQSLLMDGWRGLCSHLAPTMTDPKTRASGEGLIKYFSKQVDHLDYKSRLHNGQSIGSGMVEGAAKTAIGKRLKQTGARWRLERVNRMATLCCGIYSDWWEKYWTDSLNAKI